MTVLILAQQFDPTVDAVVERLSQQDVNVFRTDVAAFPTELRMAARMRYGRWEGQLWNDHHEVSLTELRSIWRRHPNTYAFPATLSVAEKQFAYREAKLGFGGVLAALDVLYVNHPNRTADAIFKPYQWAIASRCGLHVADTLISNDPDSARDYLASGRERTVTKGLGPAGIREDGETNIAYTHDVDDIDITDIDAVEVTATTFQRFVPKAHEVRLTVIGDAWFPIAIFGQTSAARTDWRSDPHALSYEYVEVPATVASSVREYLRQAQLVFAGIDFVIRPDGEWVFLEANANPQFGWLEAATGAPMVSAMAALLAKGRT